MKSTFKFLWIAVCIANIIGMGSQRALAYTDPPPSITWLTANQTQCATTTVQIGVGAVNATSYQWRKNGVNLVDNGHISGANSATLTINNITTADAGDYSVVVSNPYGSATSGNSHLTVQTDPPVIVTQPVNQAVLLGASAAQVQQFQSSGGVYTGGNSASFSVVATGCNPLSYQWKKNGVNLTDGGNISGAQSANLQINFVTMADAGTYMVVVTNALGAVSSTAVSLHVCQMVTSTRDQIITNEISQMYDGRDVVRFHFDSPTTISGFSFQGSGLFGRALMSALLIQFRELPMSVQVFNSAIPDQRHQIYSSSTIVGNGAQVIGTSAAPSTDYAFVFNVLRVQGPINYPIIYSPSPMPWDPYSFDYRGTILVSLIQTVSTSDWDCQGPTPLPPVAFAPDSGGAPLDVTLSVPGYPSAQIYYTIDGTTPTRSSPLYSGPIHVPWGITTVSAFAALGGYPDSIVLSVTYSSAPSLPPVQLNPIIDFGQVGLLWFQLPADVTMSVPGFPNAEIHYTLDGTRPTGSSPLYAAPIHITGLTTVEAVAIQTGYANGPFTVARYGQYGQTGGINSHSVQITDPPLGQTVTVGSDVTFEVRVTGDQPMSYQWQFNGVDLADGGNISGSRSSILHITAAQLSNTGGYSVKVWNWINQVQSTTVGLTVENPTAPVITEQPQSKAFAPGDTVTISVGAIGTAPFNYQWYLNGTAISGASGRTYTLPSAQTSDGGTYHVVVQNLVGSVTSADAVLTAMISTGVSLSIQADPGLNLTAGQSVTLSAAVQSASSVTYQWQFDGKDLLGETKSYLYLPDAELGNADAPYTVIVKNAAGGSSQANAQLSVSANGSLQFTKVNDPPLKIPAQHGIYVFSMDALLPPNTDAKNVRKFIVTKVDSGALLINGESFGPDNNIIGPMDWVTWTPPVVADNPPKPAFTAYASDGTHDTSANPVDIGIQNNPVTRLFAWGENSGGVVGNGYYWDVSDDNDYTGKINNQANLGLIPKDPRWKPNPDNGVSAPHPQKVLDAPDVNSIFCYSGEWYDAAVAVATDGTVWQWGFDPGFFFGLPYANYYKQASSDPPALWKWGQPKPDSMIYQVQFPFDFISLTPLMYQAPRSDGSKAPFTGVAKVIGSLNSSRMALKQDGTLWSWGVPHDRIPKEGDDRFVDTYGRIHGMSPRRVEIEGNDLTGITDGRKFVDIEGNVDSIALCKDGSVWWWPLSEPSNWPDRGYGDFDLWRENSLDLGDASTQRHLTSIDGIKDIGTPSPIIQIANLGEHYGALRDDGKVFEFGYIPQLDPSGVVAYGYGGATDDQVSAAYSREPVPLHGLPGDGLPGKVVSIALGDSFGVAVSDPDEGGHVWVWGHFAEIQGPDGWGYVPYQAPTEIDPKLLSGIVQVVAGWNYILALDKLGRVWGWGENDAYSPILGNAVIGQYNFVTTPVRIQGIEQVQKIFGGYDIAFAVGVEEDPNRIALTATPGDQKVILNWHNTPSGATQYKVYRSTDRYDNYTLIATVSEADFTDDGNGSGLSNGTAYYYKVSALVSGAETATSLEQMATPLPLPHAVGNLLVTGECRGISISWNAPDNATDCQLKKYRILRSMALTGPFIALGEVRAGTLQYFDTTADTTPFYYEVIAVNDSGESASTGTSSSVTINPNFCAAAPYIAINWREYAWLKQVLNSDDVLGTSDKVTIHWAEDPAHHWTTTPSAFRIYYRYVNHGVPFGPTYSQDVSQQDAQTANSTDGVSNDNGQPAAQYSFTWITSGLPIYVHVSAIVAGQEGEPSMEVGPPAVTGDPVTWDGTLSATPGYQQVHLEWSDNEKLCTYTVKRTATRPGRSALDADPTTMDTLAADITVPGYYDGGLTGALPSGAFASSDINIDTLSALVTSLSAQDNPVSAALYRRWTTGEKSEVTSGISAARMAELLNTAMNSRVDPITSQKVLLTDAEFQAINSKSGPGYGNVFTPKTVELFGTHSSLSDDELHFLNRLILEEAYSTYGYAGADWVKSMHAYNFYLVQGTICGDVSSVNSGWVQARQDDNASAPDPNLSLSITASAYSGMVGVDWNFYKSFNGVVAGGTPLSMSSTSVQIISAKRYNGANLIATGVLGQDYSVDPVTGAVTILTGSDLVCQTGDQVRIGFAPLSSDSSWQFWLERKLNNPGAAYERITEAGFGLAYLDQDVVNGQGYIYRVTAADRDFNLWQAESTAVIPSTSDSLSLKATAGNNYVDLAWPPIRATQITVEHSLNPDGGFEAVTSLTADNAYQNPPNTFRHTGVQNNLDHYYKVIAVTPTGVQIESPVVSARPLSSLPLAPPTGLKATQVQDSSGRRFLLAWNAEEGAAKFQVFVREGSSLKLIYEGSSPRCYYSLPADVQAALQEGALKSVDFQIAIRSVNLIGVAGDLGEKPVTWTEDNNSPPEDNNVLHLKVAGHLLDPNTPLELVGPTNVTLSVDMSIANVRTVSFYDGGVLLGTAAQGSTEYLWCHAPGGGHWLSARVEVSDANVATGAAIAIFATPGPVTDGAENVHVTIQPELSAFQTSVTDLQLPAPGLPITLSRSYSSRSTTKGPGGLATGWTANWLTPSVTVSSSLAAGWRGAQSMLLNAVPYCFFTDSSSHLVTVTLPDGESVFFQPVVANPPSAYSPLGYDNEDIKMQLEPFSSDAGTLSGVSAVSVLSPADLDMTAGEWNGLDVTFDGVFGPYTYNAPDGTKYTFSQDAHGDGSTYLLTEVKDRNGNFLQYTYFPFGGGDPNGGKLQSITHSSGRKVTFDYTTVNEIWVFDSIAGAYPVLKYKFDNLAFQNPQLLEVDHLVNRTSGAYEPTFYGYSGTTFSSEPQHSQQVTANSGRLTDINDARRIRTLHNEYHYDASGQTGDLFSQTDAAGRTTTFNLDQDNNLTVTISWTDENGAHTRSAEVQHDDSGSVSSVSQPSDDSGNTQTSSTFTYDDRGRVVAQTDANDKSKTLGYDDKNRLISQTDENGNSTTIQPDDDHFGQPGIVEDAEHHQTVYVYDPLGNPLSIKDPSGTETSYTYLDAVTGSGYSLGTRTRSERRDAPFVPFTIVTEYTYYGDDTGDASPSMGDIKSTTEKWVQSVNGSGEQTIGTPVTTYDEYDADGNRTAEVKSHTVSSGPPAVVEYVRTEYTYDARNRVTDTQIKTISPSGSLPTASQWASASFTAHTHSHTTYNSLGKQDSTSDGYNRTTSYLYDVPGNLIETKFPDNTVTRTTYDEQNHPVYVQDRVASGDVTVAPATKTTYDPAGRVAKVERLASITLTKSQTTSFVGIGGVAPQYTMAASSPGSVLTTTRTFYDSVGREEYSVDTHNVTTEDIYDAGGRKISSKVYRDASEPTYAYSGSGVPAPPANAAFVATCYTYDANGNQKTVTTGVTSIDGNGNPVDGQTTSYEYDAANRCTRTIFPVTNPSGAAYRSTMYDGLGQRIQEIDENHISTAFSYDFRGLLTAVTIGVGTPQEATTKYGYDELGNLVKQTDSNNHTTTFGYDGLGRRISRTLPDTKTETVTYDDPVNPILPNKTVTDFNQHKTFVTFDNMDRVATNQLPTVGDFSATTVTYNYNAAGQRTRVVQSGGVNRTARYAYDALGRLRVKDTPEGTLTYNYNNDGSVNYIGARLTYTGWPGNPPYSFESLTSQNSTSVRTEWGYSYNGLGQLSQFNDTHYNQSELHYDTLGNLSESTYPNGLDTIYTYNARNQLRRVRSTIAPHGSELVANFDYDEAGVDDDATDPSTWGDRLLSPTGQRRQVVEQYGGVQRTADYDYDALQRLTKESITGAQTAVVAYDGTGSGIGYDPVGNRQSRQITSGSLSGVSSYTADTFDSRDRLTRSGYSHDDNGNTIGSDSGATDYYDAENHLVKRTQSGHSDIVITYDADGNRVNKSVGGVTTTYLVDDRNPTGYAQVLEERNGNGATTAGYQYGLSLAARYVYNPNANVLTGIQYYGCDGLGSVRYLMDNMGNVTDTYTYDAFGIQIASTGTTANSYRYTGQQWDTDLGMYYLRARYYKPDTGRFWTMDSVDGDQEDPLSLHKYAYTQDSPVNNIDLTGFYTSEFGIIAHDIIAGRYLAGHPGTIINPTTGVLGALKPDIFNGPGLVYAEIKPLSFSGIGTGIAQMAEYHLLYGKLGFHRETTWPAGFGFVYVTAEPIVYFNVQGIIFYSDAVDDLKELRKIKNPSTAYRYLRESLRKSLEEIKDFVRSMAKNTVKSEEGDIEDTEGIAAIDSEEGAP